MDRARNKLARGFPYHAVGRWQLPHAKGSRRLRSRRLLKGLLAKRPFRALKNAIAIEMMLEVLRERVKGFFDLVLVVESG